ncbi:hypothetical protein VKT23_017659 [Stygiomarasmius scandens]|uniref:Uncharacterized protein n=1 Tax=Marasmiellus scandens TaxID=2682957 RepID=A0ABR1IUB7_9AGAR
MAVLLDPAILHSEVTSSSGIYTCLSPHNIAFRSHLKFRDILAYRLTNTGTGSLCAAFRRYVFIR